MAGKCKTQPQKTQTHNFTRENKPALPSRPTERNTKYENDTDKRSESDSELSIISQYWMQDTNTMLDKLLTLNIIKMSARTLKTSWLD